MFVYNKGLIKELTNNTGLASKPSSHFNLHPLTLLRAADFKLKIGHYVGCTLTTKHFFHILLYISYICIYNVLL